MAKELCKLKKSLRGEIGMYVRLIDQPTHVCLKCGRAANDKKLLCKPQSIASAMQKA
ncbi:hypothetical protein Poly24_39840 [Rosistilla carotiformis]|uniref:Uncharacterized protein n=1 Tax=Rosistilla carotiformis TaxID=2528017 RepID=A0A518JXJ5_9BACT|nr:hypothetical protein [Rosistilla carotiformis]QDV70264.1 hypothetical protein Poly24_39840 [Rosistilla carotiformis]